MGTSVNVPERNLGNEYAQTIQAMLDTIDQRYSAEAEYGPKFAGINLKNLDAILGGQAAGSKTIEYQTYEDVPSQTITADQLKQQYGGVLPKGGFAQKDPKTGALLNYWIPGYKKPTTSTKEVATEATPGLLDLLEKFSPRLSAMDAKSALAQRTADISAVEQLGGRATEAFRNANPEQAALMRALNTQAQDELAAGASLDPSLARTVAQAVRQGQTARGFGRSNRDIVEEAQFTGLQAEQLRRNRQGFAANVVGLNQNTQVDPFLAILGRPSQVNPVTANQLFGQNSAQYGVTNLFNPQNPYAQDFFNTNFNAAVNADIAEQNNKTALIGAGIGALGSLGGAAICWVAREAFGIHDPRWLLFREWLTTDAPRWLLRLYIKHGEAFARFISTRPRLKALVRAWMKGRI